MKHRDPGVSPRGLEECLDVDSESNVNLKIEVCVCGV